jgi:hypothetical protein
MATKNAGAVMGGAASAHDSLIDTAAYPMHSQGEIAGVLTLTGNPAVQTPVGATIGSAPSEGTPEKAGTGTGVAPVGGSFLGLIPSTTTNVPGNAASTSDASGDNANSSATETGQTPDDLLLDLAEAAMGGQSQPGSDDTIALPTDPDDVDAVNAPAQPAAAGGGLHPVVILGIIIGLAIGGWYIFKHRKNLAKAAKDVAP